jgi:hypothetical protein
MCYPSFLRLLSSAKNRLRRQNDAKLLSKRRAPPNTRLHPTPLRGRKVRPILKSVFGSTVISIYWCGAGEAQAVSPPIKDLGCSNVLSLLF